MTQPLTKKPMECASKIVVCWLTLREAEPSKAGDLAVLEEVLGVAAIIKLFQIDLLQRVASLLQLDLAASKVVDFAVGSEVGVVAAVLGEDSAAVIEVASAAEEEGLDIKEVVVSAEEADSVGLLMEWVMAPYLPLTLPPVLAETEETWALVGTAVRLRTGV